MIDSSSSRAANSSLAVIVPVHNGAATLRACLSALIRSTRLPDEIIVYDDASTDDSAEIAASFGAKVLTNATRPWGPAVGRNICASTTDADVLVFVDADVEVQPDAIGLLERTIIADPKVAAAFGSYDDDPGAERLAGLYANLRHHWFHQNGNRDASSFWSGLGAVRRDAFLNNGGFDRRFERPSIEDVDLGLRLKKAGWRIVLEPMAQATHHKDWTLTKLWRTDVVHRALPWSVMMVSGEAAGIDLNVSWKERIVCGLAHLLWALALLAALVPAAGPVWTVVLLAYMALNLPFYALLARRGGAPLLIAGACLHWLYHVYASSVFAYVFATWRGRKPVDQEAPSKAG